MAILRFRTVPVSPTDLLEATGDANVVLARLTQLEFEVDTGSSGKEDATRELMASLGYEEIIGATEPPGAILLDASGAKYRATVNPSGPTLILTAL